MQVRAIMEAACTVAEQGVKVEPEIMIPLTGTVGEMKLTCEKTRKVAESALVEMGVPVKYTIGTMIEVPRAALIADKIAQDAEFFSFGTNDLTQMTFGYSRDDVAKFLPDYLEKGLLPHDPFAVLDQEGVGELIKIGIERGRRTPTRPQGRHLRRARRRAVVRRVLPQGGHDLRVVLTVHDSHRAPQCRPGPHQAARGLGRRRAEHIGDCRVKLPGARIVLECLKREGVDLIFGLPGGAVLPIYDALYDFEGLRHILVRQEAAAGHAAEGYARATGKVGVCLVTSGPAATNLVTALQDALMDSIPIVALHRAGAHAPDRQRRLPGGR